MHVTHEASDVWDKTCIASPQRAHDGLGEAGYAALKVCHQVVSLL